MCIHPLKRVRRNKSEKDSKISINKSDKYKIHTKRIMRSVALLLVSLVLVSFILGHVKEVEAQKDIFLGGCGKDGNKTCIDDFVKKGAMKPKSCECDDFGDEHLCRCTM
ncbi:putative defensin-like protein 234 [Capsella rubella]|uniref:putative defensin-like protein 234 n=1 Tax=Capsella rubella TaxID=81985 RepID=UPI000CD5460D|nr:putative defensin-like protein 234 [Capsella rubella]